MAPQGHSKSSIIGFVGLVGLVGLPNRKPYKPFQLTPKSTTLDDLDSSAQMMRLSELTTEIWKKIDPYYKRQKYNVLADIRESSAAILVILVDW